MNEKAHTAFAQRVVRSFVYSGVGNLVGRLLGLLGIAIGMAMLDADEFGASRFALSTLAIFRAITEAGLGIALVQAKKATRSQIDSLFWTSLGLTIGTYLFIFFVFAPLVPAFWDKIQDGEGLVRGICFSVALYTFYFIPRAHMERELKLGRLILIDNVSMLFGTVLLFITAARGHGAWAFVWFEVGQRACQAVLSFIARPFIPRLHFDFSEVKGMFSFAMYATGSRILYNLYSQADFLVVAKVFGDTALGVYGAAWHILSEPIKGLATIVNQVAYPAFARLQDDLDRLRSYFFTIIRVSFAVTGSVLGLVVVFAGPVIFSIDEFAAKYGAAVPLIWLFGIMGLLKTVAPLIPQLLNATGNARLNFFYSLACAITLPVAFYIGAQFGLYGVVYAWAFGYPIVVLLLFYFASLALELPFRAMIRSFAGIRVAGPVFFFELALVWFFEAFLELPGGWVAALGVPLSLLAAAALIFASERENLRSLKRRANAGQSA